MIEIIPAIDLINGECVRLYQGNYQEQKVYYKNPLDFAKLITDHGIPKLHLVDLDGAKAGSVKNIRILETIAQSTTLEIDFGGGIKTVDSALQVIEAGAAKINLGSIAVKDPEVAQQIIKKVGADRIILAADLRDQFVAINAWQDQSSITWKDLITDYQGMGITQFLCTDVSKDGTLSGPAIELYQEMLASFPSLHLIASGGVANFNDLIKLDQSGVPAVVVGKAILEGAISLAEIGATWTNA